MFYEITILYIYSFNGTYKEKYNKTIDYINKLREFISFDNEYGRGEFMYFLEQVINMLLKNK